MKLSFKSRIVSVLAVTALSGTVMVGAPTVASAAPQCVTANFVTQCAGVGADGAPYSFIAPANFNGTVFIWNYKFFHKMFYFFNNQEGIEFTTKFNARIFLYVMLFKGI